MPQPTEPISGTADSGLLRFRHLRARTVSISLDLSLTPDNPLGRHYNRHWTLECCEYNIIIIRSRDTSWVRGR